MNGITTVTTKGQVTIPGEVRQLLQIKIGDKVSFNQISSNLKQVVLRIIPANIVEKLSGSLSTKVNVTSHKKARHAAGNLLVKKYKIK